MKQKRRKTGFFLKVVSASILLLALGGVSACAHHSATSGPATGDRAAMNPVSQNSDAPPTTAASPGTTTTGTTTAGAKGVYVGQVPSQNAWVGIDSNGSRVVAFATDGSKSHAATFAQWFRGTLTNNKVTASSETNSGGQLQANLTSSGAAGTVTLKNGKSIPFVAREVPPTSSNAGLYRGDRMVNGTRYVGGWVVMPSTQATPGTSQTPRATATARATSTATSTAGMSQQGSALSNTKDNSVLPAPALTAQDISARQVSVPKLGTFNLRQCQQSLC